MNNHPTIVGAGLAGLLAAHAFPNSQVIERADEPRQLHRALLRFRGDSVARLTGIEFKKVRVRKGIWARGCLRAPDISIANQYANKVLGHLGGERSIWNIDAVDRWIAPETFYEQLVESVGSRILWGTSAQLNGSVDNPVISTAPLPATLEGLGFGRYHHFDRAAITVTRGTIAKADVYQTIYFPEPETPMYRASITGHTMIIEAIDAGLNPKVWLPRALVLVERAFALGVEPRELVTVEQKYGKIEPLADAQRKELLFKLTTDHGIYSLGRFATWRNILLDDVVQDIDVIKRLLRSSSYDVRRKAS